MTAQQLLGVVAVFGSVSLCGVVHAQIAEGQGGIPSDQVARAFGYNGSLLAKNITDRNRRTNPGIISSYVYSAADNTFVPTTITLGAAGTILTKALASQFQAAIEQGRGRPTAPGEFAFVREITTEGGGKGFAFLSGVGPGGTGYSAVLTDPQNDRDIAVAVNFSTSNPIQTSERTQAYFENLHRDQMVILDLLQGTIPQLASMAAAVGQNPDGDPVVSKDAATPALGSSIAPQSSPVATTTPHPEPSNESDKIESGPILWLLLCAFIAVAGGALAWRARQRVHDKR
ncbi:MAG TPA: hypothetical protein VNP98_03915 [Chthoniobacterales bacterium]|nr:hypothetical protein [Chthoniobacterales bacterium]